MRTGILLVNLGTPDAPTAKAVRPYLRQFLSDPRVIDIAPWARWLLLNLIILPFRPRKSAEAYAKIWTEQGSPLLVFSEALRDKVQERLGDSYEVVLGMRYGNPSVASAVEKLRQARVEKIVALPLFPQYAAASNGSAIEEILWSLNAGWNFPDLRIISSFHDHAGFVQAQAEIIKDSLGSFQADHVLFSFHGVPVRHVEKSETGAVTCDRVAPCPAISDNNRFCYRAQCYESAALIAQAAGLSSDIYSVSFQSRLGRTPWVKPYTDEVLPQLAAKGVKRLAVTTPAFVADCLETLEEIGMRGKEQWLSLGGEDLLAIPCVNDHPRWVEAVGDLVR